MTYKEEFIKFMEDSGVLKFGEFTLKSGRKAPYFLNAGSYCTGEQLVKLGHYYAQCIKEHNVEFDTLFGPAYKGMPLACSAALAELPEQTQEEIFLYYFQHLTQKEIGEQIGWTRSTIGRHIQLALKRLKAEMEVLSHE